MELFVRFTENANPGAKITWFELLPEIGEHSVFAKDGFPARGADIAHRFIPGSRGELQINVDTGFERMLNIANISLVALVAGVALHALLGISWHMSFGSGNFFVSCVIAIVSGLATILPGLVTGLVAGSRGILHGALLSAGIFLYIVAKAFLLKSGLSFSHALETGLRFLSVAAVAQCLVTSLAGVTIRRHGLFY